MKPLKAVPPEDKLPKTFHLSVVKDPSKGATWWSVILSEQQGEKIVRRKVMDSSDHKQLALDEFHRLAERVFYFDEGSLLIEAD